jgi:ribosomal protein L35
MTMLLGPTKNAGVTKTDAEDQETERSQEAVQGDRNGQADASASNAESTCSRRSRPKKKRSFREDVPVAKSDVKSVKKLLGMR